MEPEPAAVDVPIAHEGQPDDESGINGMNLRNFPLFGKDAQAMGAANLEMMFKDYIDAGLQMAVANNNDERRGPRVMEARTKTRECCKRWTGRLTRRQRKCLRCGCWALILIILIVGAVIAVAYIKMSALEKLAKNKLEIASGTTVTVTTTTSTPTSTPITTTSTITKTETNTYCPWAEGTDVLAHDADTLEFRHAIIVGEWGKNPQDTGKFVHYLNSDGRWAKIDWDDCGKHIRPLNGEESPIQDREQDSEGQCPYYEDDTVKVLPDHTEDDDDRPWKVVNRRGGGALILQRSQKGMWNGIMKEPVFRLVLFSDCPTILEKVG